jgi:hypothetical protein
VGELENIKTYKAGGTDSRGRVITSVLAFDPTFVIYVADGELQLAGEMAAYDKDIETQRLIARLLDVTPDNPRQKSRYLKRIAVGVAACMIGDSEGAKRILTNVLESSETRLKNQGRLVYLLGTGIVSLLTLTIAWVAYKSSPQPLSIHVLGACSVAAGGLGGVLSVCFRLRQVEIEIDDGWVFSLALGASRAVVAVLGACLVFVGAEADLFFGALVRTNPLWAPIALGFVAGFSETFVPNLVKKTEQSR